MPQLVGHQHTYASLHSTQPSQSHISSPLRISVQLLQFQTICLHNTSQTLQARQSRYAGAPQVARDVGTLWATLQAPSVCTPAQREGLLLEVATASAAAHSTWKAQEARFLLVSHMLAAARHRGYCCVATTANCSCNAAVMQEVTACWTKTQFPSTAW